MILPNKGGWLCSAKRPGPVQPAREGRRFDTRGVCRRATSAQCSFFALARLASDQPFSGHACTRDDSRTLAPPPPVLGFFVATSHHLHQGIKLFSNQRIVLSHLCLCRPELLGEGRIIAQDPRHGVLQRAQARRQRYKLVLGCKAIVDCLCPARLR